MDQLRRLIFHLRGVLPIPFFLALWFTSRPTPERLLYGLIFLVIGELIRLWAAGHIPMYRVDGQAQAPRLATGGPYSFVRNPLYVGNLLMAMAYGVAAGGWWWPLGVVLFFGVEYAWLIVPHEEAFLAEQFGASYAEYRQKVPRWIGIVPRLPKTSPFRLMVSIRSEMPTMCFHAFAYSLFLLRLEQPFRWPAIVAFSVWLIWSIIELILGARRS